ncbi:hypothetical protein F2Q70_00009127 [Brassica cretica]|uniref:No apical meristem-associated C-terminal domain-containing protein n=1 Tax=Brassica cretica TaxID=69181 RepID=A0A8S9M8B4_BRACR|nr:hypothetical protein F2Q70_00009127 [Brassica cretica]
MNPLNQHSQSSGYMGLLQRQQSGALHQNSPYESFHSEASDFPQFNSQTSPINVGDEEVRPEGVKAAKGKRSNAKGKSVADITTVWEMRKDDLDRKEKQSKLAILDTLLVKTQPLTAAEEEAKNKLLAQYI